MTAARYDFASDNVAGAMPEVMEALVAANAGAASGYGTDPISAAAADRIRDELTALNVEVMDGPTGATWRIKDGV